MKKEPITTTKPPAVHKIQRVSFDITALLSYPQNSQFSLKIFSYFFQSRKRPAGAADIPRAHPPFLKGDGGKVSYVMEIISGPIMASIK
jgi:hypothetical protein